MVNLKFYRNLCFVIITIGFCNKSKAQNVKQVVDETVSSYQGTSYQAYHSVTLAPGFSFSPNETNTSFFVSILGQDHKPDDPNLLINNAVRMDIVKVAGITSQSQINSGNAQTQISYMDGLGRPIQRITQQGSPLQKDMVQFMTYDQYGRQPKQYLPYTATTSDGSMQLNPLTAQQAFYQTPGQQIATDNSPFAVTVYDNSPLERVLEGGAPGADWQPGNHTVKNQFRLNTTADHIMIWTVNGPTNTYYAETQLSVNDLTDENGNHVLSFTNKLGQLVSKKVQSNTGYLETIYIYDDVANMAYQVSPEGVKRIYAGTATWNSSFIATWASSYIYDEKNRLVTKQSPGADPVYMVYDANNRLMLVQDGRIRNAYGSADKWYATKYDVANRVVISGLYTYANPGTTGSSNRERLQNYLDGLVYNNTSTFAYEGRASGTTYGYTNQAFPAIADADVLLVNYYDDYDFNNDGTPDFQYANPGQAAYATTNATDNSGFLTGTYKRVIGTNNWIKQAVFYDQFGNAIQKQGNSLINQTGLDITSNAYDIYAGHITQTMQTKATGSAGITVVNKMAYDKMDRVTQIAMNINGGTDQVLARYEYNELGQLKDKKLHQKADASFLQTVDYRYNIRGWLTGINNSSLSNADGVNTANDDVFGMTFLYNQADGTGLNNTRYYNGKVSAIKWKANDQFSSSANPVRERSYIFTYDNVDRLTGAVYAANSGTGWNAELNAYNETIGGYDDNGNILSLQRNAQADDNHAAVTIDDLTYHYVNNASNQLSYIADASHNAMGYNGSVNSTSQYSYDTDGNLTGDVNKGQTISYNDLNKVSSVVTATGTIQYTYDASGSRIRKTVFNPVTSSTTTYDYIDGFIYTNNSLTSFATAEGRVLAAGSSFTYEYHIKDHLGNVRVSFHDNGSGIAAITQENEYYPFGMTMRGVIERTAQNTNANKQLFNGGTELQDDLGFENSYSTQYREYDPQTGRFNAIDPMVDKYAGWTPYNFAFNDPVGMNDPTGGDPIENPGFSLDTWEMVEHAWYATAPGGATHNEPDGKGQFRESSIMSVNGVYGYWEIKSSWEYNNPKHTYTTDNNGVDMGNAHWVQNFVPLNTTFWSATDYNNDNSTVSQGSANQGSADQDETNSRLQYYSSVGDWAGYVGIGYSIAELTGYNQKIGTNFTSFVRFYKGTFYGNKTTSVAPVSTVVGNLMFALSIYTDYQLYKTVDPLTGKRGISGLEFGINTGVNGAALRIGGLEGLSLGLYYNYLMKPYYKALENSPETQKVTMSWDMGVN